MGETTLIAELDMAYQSAMEKARDANNPDDPEQDFGDAMLLKQARDRLAAIEARVLIREECSPPSWALTWRKSADGRCIWRGHTGRGLLSHGVHMGAPDLRPDQRGPITLPIVSLEE